MLASHAFPLPLTVINAHIAWGDIEMVSSCDRGSRITSCRALCWVVISLKF